MRTVLCFYLGDKHNHQGDVDREDDGQGGKGEGGILLRGEDHGDWSCDHTQHLRKRVNGKHVPLR